MGRILVIGSYNQDTVLRVPRFPQPGETLTAISLDRFHGGKGSNQAVAAARAGAEVAIAAAIGTDEAGDGALALWAAEGIGTAAVQRTASAPTGQALILVEDAGENEIVVVAGANALLAPPAEAMDGAGIVLAQLETPLETTIAAFAAARARGARTLLNAAPAQALPDRLLGLTDMLVVNETEAGRLLGQGGAAAALAGLLARRLGCAEGVVTAGGQGAYRASRDGATLHVPAPPAQVVDSTGAGDAFVGAVAAALAEGLPMQAALRRGVVAGALACGRPGAVPSLPRRDAILAAGG